MTGMSVATVSIGPEVGVVAAPTEVDPALAEMFAGLLAEQDVVPVPVATAPVVAPPIISAPADDVVSADDDTDPAPDRTEPPTDPVLSLPIMGAPLLMPLPAMVAALVPTTVTLPAAASPASSLTVAQGMPSAPPVPVPPHGPTPGMPFALDGPIAPRAGFGGKRPVASQPEPPPQLPPIDPPPPPPPGTRLPMQPSPDMPDIWPTPDEPPPPAPGDPVAPPTPVAIDGPIRPTKVVPVQGVPNVPDDVLVVQDSPPVVPPQAPMQIAPAAPESAPATRDVPPVAVDAKPLNQPVPPPIRAAVVRPEQGVELPAVAVPTVVESTPHRHATRQTGETRSPEIAAAPMPMAVPDQPAAATPTTPLADRAVAHRLDLAAGDRWLDQLARDIAQTAGNDGQLRFRLNPEHLGSLQVEVRHTAEGASIRLSADSEAARAILADARSRLLAEAQAQGVRIADAQVSGGGGQSSRQGEGQRAYQPVPPPPPRAAAGNIVAVTVNEPIGAIAERYA